VIVLEKGGFLARISESRKGRCVCVIMHAEKIRVLKVSFCFWACFAMGEGEEEEGYVFR